MYLGAARYFGLDGSAGVIAVARDRPAVPGVAFAHRDIEDLSLGVGDFDLVTSRMAFHYIDSLGPVLDRICAALRPGGRLIFTVCHPVITSHDSSSPGPRTNWIVDDYFHRDPRQRPWFGSTVTWHHRTLADHVRLISERGLRLDLIDECEPDAARFADDRDELQRRRRVPLILLVGASLPQRSIGSRPCPTTSTPCHHLSGASSSSRPAPSTRASCTSATAWVASHYRSQDRPGPQSAAEGGGARRRNGKGRRRGHLGSRACSACWLRDPSRSF